MRLQILIRLLTVQVQTVMKLISQTVAPLTQVQIVLIVLIVHQRLILQQTQIQVVLLILALALPQTQTVPNLAMLTLITLLT